MTDDQLLHAFRIMERSILVEQRILRMIEEGASRVLLHSGRGQEAIGAGACAALRKDDMLFYSHRGVTQLIAKGIALEPLVGDFAGRLSGATKGLGAGVMHMVDREIGLMGSSGTLGGGFVMSAGTALGSRQLGDDRVTLHIFGEGSANRGTFHEAANAAALWKLPMIWLCENNGYAVSVKHREATPIDDIAVRAAGYGMPSVIIDGQDVEAVYGAVADAVARARAGEGPSMIEAKTVRMRGHYEGDPQTYRSKDEIADARTKDPQLLVEARLAERGIGKDKLDAIRAEEREALEIAVEAAMQSPKPGRERMFAGVLAGDEA